MIGFLTGAIHTKESSGQIIVLVGGVGYAVIVPTRSVDRLEKSQTVELFIYTHVREDALNLYGFLSQDELALFKLVLSVSGIGPKTALGVINQGAELVRQAIKEADADFFTAIPRLGRKNAQKIIIELKNKLGGLKELNLSQENTENTQAIEALQTMGYAKKEAEQAIREIPLSIQTVEEKINFALRQFGKMKFKDQ